jgi:hypothetical protein
MPQSWDMGQIILLPLRRKACRGFSNRKNPMTSVGSEPAILGTRGQHANHDTTEAAQNRQTSMPPAEFELTISAGERPQSYTLDSAANVTGLCLVILHFLCKYMQLKSLYFNPL